MSLAGGSTRLCVASLPPSPRLAAHLPPHRACAVLLISARHHTCAQLCRGTRLTLVEATTSMRCRRRAAIRSRIQVFRRATTVYVTFDSTSFPTSSINNNFSFQPYARRTLLTFSNLPLPQCSMVAPHVRHVCNIFNAFTPEPRKVLLHFHSNLILF